MLTLLLFLSLVALVLLEQKTRLGVKWVDGISSHHQEELRAAANAPSQGAWCYFYISS